MNKIIVTRDHFGLSISINDAVIKSFTKGILTTTSLMVAAPAADHAIENAKKLPKLNVGLHLVLSNGIAELPASEIPNLVNNTGEFQINKFYSGINFFFNINARIVKNLVSACADTCPKALIGIITNHVNTTVAIAAGILKQKGVYNPARLFGITTLDIIR
mgnify:CR=1 FL=1